MNNWLQVQLDTPATESGSNPRLPILPRLAPESQALGEARIAFIYLRQVYANVFWLQVPCQALYGPLPALG